MAIFGFKKKNDEKLEQGAQAAKKPARKTATKAKAKPVKADAAEKTKAVAVPQVQSGFESGMASVIIRPRVTEKSGVLSQGGVYTFEVSKDSNKAMVAKAVRTLYKVNPVKVTMINTPVKNVFVKGRKGTVSGIRKAIVTVKKGEKIDFV